MVNGTSSKAIASIILAALAAGIYTAALELLKEKISDLV